jgi:hypothetical protein
MLGARADGNGTPLAGYPSRPRVEARDLPGVAPDVHAVGPGPSLAPLPASLTALA